MNEPSIPFLTDLDSRAAVKGSRDPLGAQAVWTRFGRHVVGNLTTVTTSVRDFTTLLLGYFWAERVSAETGPGSELATFLKWEQLASYSRAKVNEDYSFRGTERVKQTLNQGSRVTLSDGRAFQILSNQQTYGIWGLYSVASAASGLVEQDPARLTPAGLQFVERFYLPLFRQAGFPNGSRIIKLLSQSEAKVDLEKAGSALSQVVAKILRRRTAEVERKFYYEHLVEGGPDDSTNGRQKLLAQFLGEHAQSGEIKWSPAFLLALEKEARAAGVDGETLGYRLARIRTCESVLALAARLFAFMQGFDGKAIVAVGKIVRDEWGPRVQAVNVASIRELRYEFAEIREDISDRWIGFAETLGQGDYVAALRLLIEQNEATMQARGGAAWISEESGKLIVRVRDEQGGLPSRIELANLWRFPYFLDSILAITSQLRPN
jgi:hypothetical protein